MNIRKLRKKKFYKFCPRVVRNFFLFRIAFSALPHKYLKTRYSVAIKVHLYERHLFGENVGDDTTNKIDRRKRSSLPDEEKCDHTEKSFEVIVAWFHNIFFVTYEWGQ